MKGLLMPGVWVDDDGGLHIDIVAVLAAAGYADTVENRATMLAAVRVWSQVTTRDRLVVHRQQDGLTRGQIAARVRAQRRRLGGTDD